MSEEAGDKTPEKTFTAADIQSLRDELQGTKTELSRLKEEYKGVSKDELFALRSANKELQEQVAKKSPEDLEAWKQNFEKESNERYSATIEELKSELKTVKHDNKTLRVYDRAMSKAADIFTQSGLELLRIKAERELDLNDKGEIVVKDDSGKPRISKADPRFDMGLDEWIEEKKTTHEDLVKNKQISGGMQTSSARSTGQISQESADAARAARLQRLSEARVQLARRQQPN